ncbi:MAG: alpha/beta hydrolase [Pseudooceanicola sp.]
MKPLVVTLVLMLVIPAALSLGLIVSQRPGGAGPAGGGLDFSRLATARADPLPTRSVTMRDGTALAVRHLPGPDGAPLLVLVHGSGWHGGQFDGLARALEGAAEIVVPDLRGHGADPVRRGDVDYIGQMEDDIADLVGAFRAEGQRVVLAGHSSGGGLVVRFAGGAHGGLMNAAVLMAPFLKYDAPVTRENSGGWARPLTRRIIGLTMLNAAGITALNHLVAIEFNMPDSVLDGPQGDLATTAYSFRLNTGYAPRGDYLADVAALPDFVLVAGAEDEAFVAAGYEPLMSEVTPRGRYEIVPGAGHLDIFDRPETLALIREVLDAG